MKHFFIVTLTFLGITFYSSSQGIAGCDKEIADADLQIAAPLTETEIRTLIAEAETISGLSVEQTQTAAR